MLKLCVKCLREYPATLEFFYKHPKTKDGLQSWCKKCTNECSKKWHKENPEYHKKYHRNWVLKHYYNITTKEYNEMLEKQNYQCEICGKHESEFKNGLGMDHNHENNKNRGLLCLNCNTDLSPIEKYIKKPDKWDKYLKKYK